MDFDREKAYAREDGMQQKAIETATNLLKKNIPAKTIA